jgi:acetyl-CoA carboxylase biotin carboxyl carrier protein
VLTFEQIQEIIASVAEHGIESVEIERSGFRLSVVGHSPPVVATQAPAPSLTPAPPAPVAGPAPPKPETGSEETASEPDGETTPEGHVVTSPIVGTFYAAPSPDADPYVRIGDQVKKGQVLCIVEAMKLMNEIESDVDGVVVEIFPKNAQPVEFGERLFAIKTG